MKAKFPIIQPNSIADSATKQNLALPIADVVTQLRTMLNSGLTIQDNMNASIVSVTCTHGVMASFQNPTPSKPLFFLPISTSTTSGAAALPLQGTPILNTSLSNNQLGLTVQYQLPVGEQLELALTTTQSLTTSGSSQTITWSGIVTAASKVGTALSWDGATKINILESGLYLVHAKATFLQNATGVRAIYIRSAAGTQFSSVELPAAPVATFTQISESKSIVLSSGAALVLAARQDSGGALSLNGNGTLSSQDETIGRTVFSATRVRNDNAYSAIVTGILWGG